MRDVRDANGVRTVAYAKTRVITHPRRSGHGLPSASTEGRSAFCTTLFPLQTLTLVYIGSPEF